jgi:hypothetical protein
MVYERTHEGYKNVQILHIFVKIFGFLTEKIGLRKISYDKNFLFSYYILLSLVSLERA